MLYEKKVNGNMKRSEESMTLLTAYGFPHHRYRSLAFSLDDAFRSPSCCVGKTGNGTVTQSEESMPLVTSLRLPSPR